MPGGTCDAAYDHWLRPSREIRRCVHNGSVPVKALALQICAFCACGLG